MLKIYLQRETRMLNKKIGGLVVFFLVALSLVLTATVAYAISPGRWDGSSDAEGFVGEVYLKIERVDGSEVFGKIYYHYPNAYNPFINRWIPVSGTLNGTNLVFRNPKTGWILELSIAGEELKGRSYGGRSRETLMQLSRR